MSGEPFIVACIPALNEERSIAKVVVKTSKHVNKVIVVDDGSNDMTGEIAEKIGAEVIRHERNMGYGAALASLFKRTREISPDVMVTLDADEQHNPDSIPSLIEPILKGEADIVIGSRFIIGDDGDIPRYRKMAIKKITSLANLTSYREITDAQSGLRAYSRKAIHLIMPVEQGMSASIEIIMKAKDADLKVKEVPVKINYDVEKPSTLNPLLHAVDVVLNTVKQASIKCPLFFYGLPGLFALVVAIVFWIWTLQIFAEERIVVTNIAMIAIGATLVGLLLLTTAVLLWVLVTVIREDYNYRRI